MRPPYALVFPGQGSQFVGMGRALLASAKARDLVAEAEDALGFKLSRLMLDGPEAELRRTDNAQAAVLVHSLALLAAAEEQSPGLCTDAAMALGHSLGEYTALVAAEALALRDAVRLVTTRGQLMQQCAAPEDVGMCALFPCTADQARGLAAAVLAEVGDGHVCDVANINSPSQTVISGTKAAMECARRLASAHKIRKCVPLAVGSAFHSRVLQPAVAPFAEALQSVDIRQPRIPVVSNVTANPVANPEDIRARLIQHVCAPVLWAESVLYCKSQSIQRYIELGPKAVLSPMIAQTDKSAETRAVVSVDELASLAPATPDL